MSEQNYSLETPPARYTGSSDEDQQSYQSFTMMEDLIDKLKLLNYDEEFIKTLKMRPLNRHYFAIASNPGEQFFMFTALAAWLIKKIGLPFEQPQEYDDPNSTIASILEALRTLGIAVDFSPNKLKKGSGLYILQTLTALVDKAMEAVKFTYKKPKAMPEEGTTSEIADDDGELLIERVEEEMAEEDSDVDEDNVLLVDDLYSASAYMNIQPPQREEIIESNTTSEAWNLELERVLPMLKVTVKTTSDDWRSHLESMKQYQTNLTNIITSVTPQLDKLSRDIDNNMAKINNREKLINNQFEQLVNQYRTLQDELAVVNERYREVNGGVIERQKTLNQITDQLESVKQEMEERGATMSDGTPLVQIKKSIKDIRKEISEMDIYIAVAEHVIVESKLREKTLESQLLSSGLM